MINDPARFADVTENPSNLINIAKRELERERELLMSKSLPGMPEESQERSSQDDGSDSESDTESDDKTTELQAEINDIQSDIEIKTKLIEQLELSQQRMTVSLAGGFLEFRVFLSFLSQVMKQHYEEKLNMLSAKIANTQKERDQVLANMGRELKSLSNCSVFSMAFSLLFRIHERQRHRKGEEGSR
jgi:kinesin family member 21